MAGPVASTEPDGRDRVRERARARAADLRLRVHRRGGPALSLHTRTQALHQTLAGLPDTTKTVQVSSTLAQVAGALRATGNGQPGPVLGEGALAQSTSDIARGLAATPLPLAGGDWAGLSASSLRVTAGAARSAYAAAPGAGPGAAPRVRHDHEGFTVRTHNPSRS